MIRFSSEKLAMKNRSVERVVYLTPPAQTRFFPISR